MKQPYDKIKLRELKKDTDFNLRLYWDDCKRFLVRNFGSSSTRRKVKNNLNILQKEMGKRGMDYYKNTSRLNVLPYI